MNRYFKNIKLTSIDAVDNDTSELMDLVVIKQNENNFEIKRILFDSSIDIIGPKKANNKILSFISYKDNVDGLIKNIMKLGTKCLEVDELEFEALYNKLMEKANYLQKVKKRKLNILEKKEEQESKLP